jgi:hypothetical protein
MARYAHAGSAPRKAPTPDIARTCFDHAAGRLGVAVFSTLIDRGGLTAPGGGELTLGPQTSAFTDLGVDPYALDPGRRKLATACLDRTYRVPHLGGALGSAVLDALVARGLVTRSAGTRGLTITADGAARLPVLLPGFTTG